MTNKIKILLREGIENTKIQYQVRYIDEPIFYKKNSGDDKWKFISAEEFVNNVYDGKLVKWNKN